MRIAHRNHRLHPVPQNGELPIRDHGGSFRHPFGLDNRQTPQHGIPRSRGTTEVVTGFVVLQKVDRLPVIRVHHVGSRSRAAGDTDFRSRFTGRGQHVGIPRLRCRAGGVEDAGEVLTRATARQHLIFQLLFQPVARVSSEQSSSPSR
jgi:hypothetical protein